MLARLAYDPQKDDTLEFVQLHLAFFITLA